MYINWTELRCRDFIIEIIRQSISMSIIKAYFGVHKIKTTTALPLTSITTTTTTNPLKNNRQNLSLSIISNGQTFDRIEVDYQNSN